MWNRWVGIGGFWDIIGLPKIIEIIIGIMEDETLCKATAWAERFMHYSSISYKKQYAQAIADNLKATKKMRDRLIASGELIDRKAFD